MVLKLLLINLFLLVIIFFIDEKEKKNKGKKNHEKQITDPGEYRRTKMEQTIWNGSVITTWI